MRPLLGLLLAAGALHGAETAADLARGLREISLDPAECYRVRELNLVKEDARFYFTDGYLIFAQAVGGARTAAVFSAEVEGGDGEVLILPPDKSERRSFARYAGTPNLDEHISSAIMVFSDNSYARLFEDIRANPFSRKDAEAGARLSEKWTPVVRNICGSFETRTVLDVLSRNPDGFFVAALAGRTLGNFDIMFEPRGTEQIVVGSVATRNDRSFFDIWTSFTARSKRRAAPVPPLEFTLKDYRIDATLEPDLDLKVTARVKVVPRQGSELALPFDIARPITVRSVTIDGKPAEVLQRESLRSNLIRNTGNDLFVVVPPEPLQAGREYDFEFRHEGKVVFEAGNKVYYVGARGNWYPNRGLQFARFDMTFRYPRSLDLVTPGEVVEDRTEGEWRTTRRRVDTPIRMAGFNLGRYERERISHGDYTLEVCANRSVEKALEPKPVPDIVFPPNWGRPRRPEIIQLPPMIMPSPVSRLQELASEIASAMDFMKARFGPPALPSVTVSPVPGTFGQGFPGLIYLSTLSYLGLQEKAFAQLTERQRVFFAQILHAHETAHQWWGNIVTAAGYHDEWIMEALANYSALLFLEKRRGLQTLDSALEEYRNNLLVKDAEGETVESAGPIVLGGRLESSISAMAWRNIIYGKGSWIIHMMRRRMGDERFLKMLAELRRQYERKSIGTDELRRFAAKFLPPRSTDPQLESFFDQWVYGTGIPSYKLSYSLHGMRLTGTVKVSGVSEDFTAPVPIEVQFGRSKEIHWVEPGLDPPVFSIPLKQKPVRVVFDPGVSVLRK